MPEFEQALLRLKEQLGISTDKAVGELLGLQEKAFNARKRRKSFPEKELRALAQRRPDLGVDVDYVLSGIAGASGFAFAPDTQSSFGAVLNRMYECLGSPVGIGGPEALGVGPLLFARWREGGAFPARFLAEFAREHGVTVEWLEYGWLPKELPGGAYPTQSQSQAPAAAESPTPYGLSEDERALLENYRAASSEGKRIIRAAGAAAAKPKGLSDEDAA